MKKTQAELDRLFLAAGSDAAQASPRGYVRGKTSILPGFWLGRAASFIYNIFWQGKTFNLDRGVLTNRILGCLDLYPADVLTGKSRLDGRPAVLVDYGRRSLGARFLRDEIREVSPGFWLGRAYAQLGSRSYFLMNFTLDARK